MTLQYRASATCPQNLRAKIQARNSAKREKLSPSLIGKTCTVTSQQALFVNSCHCQANIDGETVPEQGLVLNQLGPKHKQQTRLVEYNYAITLHKR